MRLSVAWIRINFYPRPPRGGRRFSGFLLRCQRIFLSTPSARRATLSVLDTSVTATVFLSTPSARRATILILRVRLFFFYFYPRPPRGGRPGVGAAEAAKILISIHALREEGDEAFSPSGFGSQKFLSTPSARRATLARVAHCFAWLFLSTPSARRATQVRFVVLVRNRISIHALREEGDSSGNIRKPSI